jgi:hypothetical protein
VAYNAMIAKWMLVQQGGQPLTVGSSYNVLVFKA